MRPEPEAVGQQFLKHQMKMVIVRGVIFSPGRDVESHIVQPGRPDKLIGIQLISPFDRPAQRYIAAYRICPSVPMLERVKPGSLAWIDATSNETAGGAV